MRQYLDPLRYIMEHGSDTTSRAGDTRGILGWMMRFNVAHGFPALTTKKLAFRQVLAEMLWFLAGDSDVTNLHKLGCHIWDGNAYADYWKPKARFNGDAGRNYGQQWRDWIAADGRHIDQLAETIRQIQENPDSRRMVVTAWNPG